MKKIQHFVITRFNLKVSDAFTRDKSGVSTQSDDWMDHRFELFERYCLPSLAAQVNQDFIWLLFFDKSTPAIYQQRIEKARQICPQIRPCYITGVDVQAEVLAQLDSDIDVLITTRIDNDDAFRDDALSVVRAYADQSDKDLCVNFRYGFSYDGFKAEVFSQKYNPFSSLIEHRKAGGFVTISGANHGKIHQLATVKQIKTGPHWLMNVHDRNLANRMPGEFRHYNLWKPKRLKRFIKKYVLHRLRRLFWSAEFRKKYTLDELNDSFHVRVHK